MRSENIILLIEDDLVDAMTAIRAFKELKVNNIIKTVSNGEKALDYLQANKNSKPAIIFLDLNMPRMNGVEFLTILKNDEMFRTIPVVVLSTSNEEKDKLECFKLGVAGYIIKPIDYSDFLKIIDVVNSYWTHSEMIY